MKYLIVGIDKPKNRYEWLRSRWTQYEKETRIGGWECGKLMRFPTVQTASKFIKKMGWHTVFITADNKPLPKRVERLWFRANGDPCSWKRVRACRW